MQSHQLYKNKLEDLKKALFYTNQLLELAPDHPRAVGNKRYYEEVLEGEGIVDEESSRKKGRLDNPTKSKG